MICCRTIVRAVALLTLVLGSFAAPSQAQPSLTVTSNGGTLQEAQRKAWYMPFSKETGTKIVEDDWNQELAKVRTQVETKSIKWQVVEMTAINLSTSCAEGLVERVDWSKILNLKDFEDVGGVFPCGVPILNVSGGITYDADRTKNPPKTWADFWDAKKWPGKRGMLYRAEQTLEPALMADGVAPKDVVKVLSSPGGIDRAFKKLDELKPHIHWWKSGAESMQILASGEVVMAYAWNGRVAAANKADKRNFRMSFDGGFINGNNYFAFMKGAPNRDLALKFIQFATSPKPQAEFAELINYGPPNRLALPLMSEQSRATIPSGALMQKAMFQFGDAYVTFWVDNGAALTERFAKWAAQ